MRKHINNKSSVSVHTKTVLLAALSLAGVAHLSQAHAALTSSAVLNFNAGVVSCIGGDCENNGTNVAAGSWFGMDMNGNSVISATEKTAIAPHSGIHIGFTSTASGSHSGAPFGAANNYTGTVLVKVGTNADGSPILQPQTVTEHPEIDEPWSFFGNTGMDYLTKAVTVVDDQGSVKYLDFSGWTVTWNGIAAIPMSAKAWNAGTTYFNGGNGVAKITCSNSSCSGTSTYTLDYFATVPSGDPSGFGNVKYQLHLAGTVVGAAEPVPVPAAAWLFGSGLVGLMGAMRRRKTELSRD